MWKVVRALLWPFVCGTFSRTHTRLGCCWVHCPACVPALALAGLQYTKVSCDPVGPSYYTDGELIPGQPWPLPLGSSSTAADCAAKCMALAECNGFHYYGRAHTTASGRGTCYLKRGVTAYQKMNDGVDRYASVCSGATEQPPGRLDGCNKLLMWDAWWKYTPFRPLVEPWANVTCISSIKSLVGANANANFRAAL